MAIKTPTTYGDYYWAQQVEAAKVLGEDTEKALAASVAGLFNSLGMRDVLPDGFNTFFDSMTQPESFAWGAVLARFGSEMADSVLSQTMGAALKDFNYLMAEKFHDERITPTMACTLYQRQQIDDTFWASRMLSGGWSLVEGGFAYEASKEYPSVPDIMLYARYHGDPESIRENVWEFYDLHPELFDLWEFQTLQRLTTQTATKLFRRGVIEPPVFDYKMKQIGWRGTDIAHTLEDSWLLPNAMLLVQGDLQADIDKEKILLDISKADIHPDYAQTYLDAILRKPAPEDIIAYELRQDAELSDLPQKLRRVGVHDAYTEVYKTLAYQIPPVADIITMAVREAFTPDIAAKFGQYQDYPEELTEWGQKKGLTEEWTQRYWAAHWSLPSPQQGFEMIHRGIINRSELNMLLRALDVMPFWRDRLTAIAFRPLTRVDVRRMYREGILDEGGVYDAYLEHGYKPENAERMTEFTVKWVLSQQAKFTTADVTAAYAKRMITSSEASALLEGLGVRPDNISFIISKADYKRQWALTESRIKGIRNLYKKRVYDKNKARAELLRLNLPAQQVDVLMEQWYYDEQAEPTANWTNAQTLRFMKAGYITKERGIQELRELGYDTEHIDIYVRSIE